MGRRPLAAGTIVIGVLLVLLALLADTVGIGGESGFGWKQAVMLGVGVVLTLVGAALLAGRIGAGREDAGGGA